MKIGTGTHWPTFRNVVAAAALILALPGLSVAAEDSIDLTIDFAKVVKLSRPAATLVIGNPGIADAAVEDNDTLVLTGKAAGVTNLIVLDDQGDEVEHLQVRVSSDIKQLTTVFKAGERQTFSCSPVCEQVISVGDAQAAFDAATKQIQGRSQFSSGQ